MKNTPTCPSCRNPMQMHVLPGNHGHRLAAAVGQTRVALDAEECERRHDQHHKHELHRAHVLANEIKALATDMRGGRRDLPVQMSARGRK